jgi:hypothetical protein
MKKFLFAAAALTALTAAMPAEAQYRSRYADPYSQDRYGQDVSFDARIASLRARLDAGMRQGTISAREAWPLRRELAMLQRLEARYSLNGFSYAEREDLRRRLRDLRAEIRVADNGGWDRNERYGMWDDGYDRSYDRGYPTTYRGSGGPYEPVVVCERRGGVIGFIDAVTGTRDCFEVGQRVTFDLDPVPYSYRSRYRDSDDVYYRSDGRAIYTIDARTNTVLEVQRIPR